MRVNTSTVSDEETINFIYNSPYIEEHAKPNSLLDLTQQDNNRHPLIKYIDKRFLTSMEFSIMKKLALLEDIKETQTRFTTKLGFPRLLIHINDKQLHQTTITNNYTHYLNTQNLPPPLQGMYHTLNNTKVADVHDKCKNKIAAVKILGNYPDREKPIVFGNNKNTLFAATKRAIKTAPIPDEQVAQDFYQYSKKVIEHDIGDYLNNFGYSYSQWYNHLPSKKQKLIDPIHEYYHHKDIFNNKYTSEQINKILDESYTAICKAELEAQDGKPRMVCSIPQLYKYNMGPITWKLEEICSKHLRGYCGNKNLTEMEEMINKYRNQGFTKVVEGDGSGFDNTQDITLKAVDRYLYRRIAKHVYHVPKDEFLRVSQAYYKKMKVKYRNNKNKLKNYITYYVLGTVFSGDCDTTLCNTIRMALYNRFVNDSSGLVYGKDYVVFAKGDDFSVLYKPYIKDELIRNIYNKYFLSKPDKDQLVDNRQHGIGQICKFLDIGGLNSFKFCSLRSWYKNLHGDIYLTRDPSKLYTLGKYSIKYKKYNDRQKLQYHFDLMYSYLQNYPNIDIFTYMAASHGKKFLQLLPSVLKSKKRTFKISTPHYNSIITEDGQRIHLLGDNTIFEKYIEFYDTTPNEKFIKIEEEYWETIKRITQTHTTTKLSSDEIDYINEQINNEFDSKFILYDNDIVNEHEARKIIKDVFTLKNKYLC